MPNCGAESILCGNCKKERAVKYCKECDVKQLCALCAVVVHEHHKKHAVASICAECFGAPGRLTCETCEEKLCPACTDPHLAVCGAEDAGGGEDDGSEDENMIDLCTSEEGSGDEEEDEEGCGEEESEEEEEEEEEEEKNSVAADDSDFDPEGESDDENMTAGEKRKRRAEEAKENKRRKQAAAKKIAEVIGFKEVFNRKPEIAAEVSDAVLTRIRKALALGLHCGGNPLEKEHAMRRATKLMQQYGLSQADVEKTGKSDIEAAAGMVAVRLNGLYYKWPQWSYTLMSVADCMAGSESFYTKSGVRKGAKKCIEDSMTVTFYGLQASAEMAAHIFEVGYNTVMERGELEYGDKGAASKKMDYRQGMSGGLYRICRRDEKERELQLQGARERAEHAAKVKPDPDAPDTAEAAKEGEADAAKATDADPSSQQPAEQATKEIEAVPAGATDPKKTDEPMKDAEGPSAAVEDAEKFAEARDDETAVAQDAANKVSEEAAEKPGQADETMQDDLDGACKDAAGTSKDAEAEDTTQAADATNPEDKAAEDKADNGKDDEDLWCGDDGGYDDAGYDDAGIDDNEDALDKEDGPAVTDEQEGGGSTFENAESEFLSPLEKRKKAAEEKRLERELAKTVKAAEREAKKVQKAAEQEAKRIMKEEEKEAKRLAKEREKREKAAAREAKKAEKTKKSYKGAQEKEKVADPVCSDKDVAQHIDPEMRQLVLYDDKRIKVIEAVKASIKLGKGRKMKWRSIKDWKAYRKGRKDAEDVRLGAKALPAPVGSEKEVGKGKKASKKADVKKEPKQEPVVKTEADTGNNGGENSVVNAVKPEGVKDEFQVKPEPLSTVG